MIEPKHVMVCLEQFTREELLELVGPLLVFGGDGLRKAHLIQAKRIEEKASQMALAALSDMDRVAGSGTEEGLQAFQAANRRYEKAISLHMLVDRIREEVRSVSMPTVRC